MADITIDSAAYGYAAFAQPRSIVWVSPTVGYIFFSDDGGELHYRKTTDSGQNWTTEGTVDTGTVRKLAIWYDKWTSGDTGGLIHICYYETGSDDIEYRYLDTSDDSVSSEVVVYADTSSSVQADWSTACLSIVKSRDGSIYAGGWEGSSGTRGFAKGNADPPTSFSAKTDVADGDAPDRIMFLAGNETDPDDIWCIYQDVDANEITLKVYDESEDSWGESSTIDGIVENSGYWGFDCMDRHSDGHAILVMWEKHNVIQDPNAAIVVWDITDSSTQTQKTNVYDGDSKYGICALMINQQNDDLYVAYSDGTSLGNIVYKKSTDGGANWGSETSMSETSDDHRAIYGGTSIGDEGGRWMPGWYNDDLDDLLTNYSNSVEIAAVEGEGTGMKINVDDAWKDVSVIKVNVDDAWKTVAAAKINVDDAWKTIF